MHVDKHCVKMVLEYAQLLSTAHRFLDGTVFTGISKTGRKQTRYVLSDHREHVLYSATHINHPSAVWVRQSGENYTWLANMLIALCEEYTYRYCKTHKVEKDGLCYVLLKNVPKNIGNKGWSEPTPAMDSNYKVSGNSIESYRKYYREGKKHLASWKGKLNSRPTPDWYF